MTLARKPQEQKLPVDTQTVKRESRRVQYRSRRTFLLGVASGVDARKVKADIVDSNTWINRAKRV